MFDIFKNLGHFFPATPLSFRQCFLLFARPSSAKYASLLFRRFFACLFVWFGLSFCLSRWKSRQLTSTRVESLETEAQFSRFPFKFSSFQSWRNDSRSLTPIPSLIYTQSPYLSARRWRVPPPLPTHFVRLSRPLAGTYILLWREGNCESKLSRP